MRFLLFWLLIIPLFLAAQNEIQKNDSLFVLTTQDGNRYIGSIVEQDPEKLVFKTRDLSTFTILKSTIKSLKPLDQSARIVNGKVWLPNPQSSRYFFQPTGYNVKEGEVYYQNYWVLWNQLTVGISDHVSIGFGLVPLFLFGQGLSSPVWITPKLSIPTKSEKYAVGAGALIGGVIGVESSGFGIVYGINTFGSRYRNISVGLGYGYTSDDWADRPTLSISGIFRTGPSHYFITENYLIPEFTEYAGLFFIGGRFIIRRIGIDYGLVRFEDFGLPWLGLTFAFGN